MIRSNSTNLNQIRGGEVIKQGDFSSTFEYELLDYKYNKIPSLDGQNARIKLANKNGKLEISAIVENSKVSFKIGKILPAGIYQLEVQCGEYVFPSDQSVRLEITQSTEHFNNLEDIEMVQLDIKKAVEDYLKRINFVAYDDSNIKRINFVAYDDSNIKREIRELKDKSQGQSIDIAPLESRIANLESRGQTETIDLVPYLKTETAYTLFPTYATLQAQMTSNIKTKHLELGLDSLIETKLKNGDDPYITNHHVKTWYTTKAEFNNLVSRVQALESKE